MKNADHIDHYARLTEGLSLENPNAQLIETLSRRGVQLDEMSAILRISAKVIEDKWGAAFRRGKLQLAAALRHAQILNAGNGNALSQIWMGKQVLNQTDKPEPKKEVDKDVPQIKGRITSIFGSSDKSKTPKAVPILSINQDTQAKAQSA